MKKILLSLVAVCMLGTSSAVADGYPTTVVIEEGTGNWCGYCVRGIVTFEQMSQKYPDSFIGIAVHDDNKSYGYDYSCPDYASKMNLTGYPQCNVQRTRMRSDISPSGAQNLYNTFHALKAAGEFSALTATLSEDKTQITVDASCHFIADASVMYNIAVVLLEDGLPGLQANYYSGGRYGAMGGFESLGNPCMVTYNDVARGIYPEYAGGEYLDAEEAGVEYPYSLTIDMPKAVKNTDNLRVAALLLNFTNGRIVNAKQCKVEESGAGVATAIADEAKVIYTEYFTIDGRKATDPHSGLYIRIEHLDNGATRAVKEVVR